MKLGDDYEYPIKGSGESSYKLASGKSMKMKDVLFLPGLKKNLLSGCKRHEGFICRWPSPYVAKGKEYRSCSSDWGARGRTIKTEGPTRTSFGP